MNKRGELSRREFLVLSAGAAGSLVITACSPSGETTTTVLSSTTATTGSTTTTTTAAPEPVISGYWDLLREVQRRVRTSPDHVPAHLASRAAAGDVAGLVELLRDHIAVVPVNPEAWVSTSDGQRWGTRGVLRSRMGTPREIAQLLSDTLNEAGIAATVVRVPDVGAVRAVLVNPQPLTFRATDGFDDLLALGISPEPEPPQADPALALEIADKALDAFDPSIFQIKNPGELTATAQLPFVRVDTGAAPQIPDLWTPAGGVLDVDDGRVPHERRRSMRPPQGRGLRRGRWCRGRDHQLRRRSFRRVSRRGGGGHIRSSVQRQNSRHCSRFRWRPAPEPQPLPLDAHFIQPGRWEQTRRCSRPEPWSLRES